MQVNEGSPRQTTATNAEKFPSPVEVIPPKSYSTEAYTVPDIPNGVLVNRKLMGGVPIGGREGSRFADTVIKFKLTLPDNALATRPEYKQLFKAYTDQGSNGFHDGTSFILYALLKETSESVEHAVTMKRTKGGYLESHWGTRPSVIQASGQIGLFLSSVGLTPFQVESPQGNPETVLFWDPTATTILLEDGIARANNSNSFNRNVEGLVNKGLNFLGDQIGSNLLSTANASGYLGSNRNTQPLPEVTPNQAANVGTNLAFRNFRLVLDLFKHNGLLLDNLPNVAIYPSTFTAPEHYARPDGTMATRPALIDSIKHDVTTMFNMRKSSLIAPGNVLAVLPVEMYIKNTKYTGFFQNFNYSFSEDNPYTAFYDFTFVARVTERTAVFFTTGTGGRRPFSTPIFLLK